MFTSSPCPENLTYVFISCAGLLNLHCCSKLRLKDTNKAIGLWWKPSPVKKQQKLCLKLLVVTPMSKVKDLENLWFLVCHTHSSGFILLKSHSLICSSRTTKSILKCYRAVIRSWSLKQGSQSNIKQIFLGCYVYWFSDWEQLATNAGYQLLMTALC